MTITAGKIMYVKMPRYGLLLVPITSIRNRKRMLVTLATTIVAPTRLIKFRKRLGGLRETPTSSLI